MSFDQKKNGYREIDELNIKSHLNASLEEDGIRVSEDLINRTLEAIRMKSQDPVAPIASEQERQADSKVIPWFRYARYFAAVAAAGLILVLGVNSLGQVGRKDGKSETAKDIANSVAYDTSTKGSAPQEAGSLEDGKLTMEYAAKHQESAPEMEDNGADADYAADAAESPNSSMMKEDSVGITSTFEPSSEEYVEGDRGLLSFRDICPILSENTETISLIGKSDQGEKTISSREDIDNFYLLMETYAFAEGDSTEGEVLFTVNIHTSDGMLTLWLKEGNLVTSYTGGDALIENIYQTADYQQLLLNLEEWYNKY